MRNFFSARANILKAVPDLAVICVPEVKNFLAEGSLWLDDQHLVRLFGDTTKQAETVGGNGSNNAGNNAPDSIHMDEGSDNAKNADRNDALNVTVAALVDCLELHMQEALTVKKPTDSPCSVLLSRQQKERSTDATTDRGKLCLYAALAGLQMCRKEFYEAQVILDEQIMLSICEMYLWN